MAAEGVAGAIFFNHGQCCCAGSRLLVEKEIFDRVLEGVTEHANRIKVGPGLDDSTVAIMSSCMRGHRRCRMSSN